MYVPDTECTFLGVHVSHLHHEYGQAEEKGHEIQPKANHRQR